MSSINNICSSSAIPGYRGDELSISTKLRLEALGIDPSSIKTETQAQIIIAQMEAAATSRAHEQKQGGNSSREQLKLEAKQLANKVGVRINDKDSLEDILEKISEKLNILGQNPTTADKIQQYQEELESIAQRADIIVKTQKNIFNQMEMVSVSNRLILGL